MHVHRDRQEQAHAHGHQLLPIQSVRLGPGHAVSGYVFDFDLKEQINSSFLTVFSLIFLFTLYHVLNCNFKWHYKNLEKKLFQKSIFNMSLIYNDNKF